MITNNQTKGIGGQERPNEKSQKVEKVEVRQNPQSHQIKALKALVEIDNHIVKMTIDMGSPVSFLIWTSTKQTLEGSPNSKLIPAEKLNLSAQFADHNKRPILILGALKANLRSAGWEVQGAALLVTEQRTRCILGLVLQGKLGSIPLRDQHHHEDPGLTCYCASSQKVGKKSFMTDSKVF